MSLLLQKKQKSIDIKLMQNKNGYLTLPSLNEINGHDLLYKKQLIGKLINDTYSL